MAPPADLLRVLATSICAAAVLALAAACGDDDDDAPADQEDSGAESPGMGTPDVGDDAGDDAGGSAPSSVTFTLTIGAATDKAGFELCLKDDPDTCATSDADGVVSLEVPADARVAIHVDKEGYFPVTYLLTTGTDDLVVMDAYAFPTTDEVMANAEALGVTLDDSKGLFGCVASGGVDGALALSPDVGEGPFYWDEMTTPLPDPALDAFSLSGVGFYYNLDPGEYEATVTAPDKSCSSDPIFWAASAAGTLDIVIEPGRFAWGCHATCVSEGPAAFTGTREEAPDAAACAETFPNADEPSCETCTCTSCLDELNACLAEPGCIDIMECAQAADCAQAGCYTADTCMTEIDGVSGGIAGMATTKAGALGSCVTEMCEPDECTPATNGP